MQSVSLIAAQNFLIGHKAWNKCSPLFNYFIISGEVLSIRLLEKSSSVFVTAARVMIFDSKHTMTRGAGLRHRVGIYVSTARTGAPVSPRRTVFHQRYVAVTASSGVLRIADVVDLAASGANEYVLRMPRIIGDKVARK